MNGYRARELRVFAGLRQSEVAAELGIHFVTLSNWERNNATILKVYAEAIERLVNDAERVYRIKQSRVARKISRRTERMQSVKC
jgi:transcriptional regulator with XRE-family HTH domain